MAKAVTHTSTSIIEELLGYLKADRSALNGAQGRFLAHGMWVEFQDGKDRGRDSFWEVWTEVGGVSCYSILES